MSTVLSHATKGRQRISSVMECSDNISRTLNFSSPSSHFKNTQSSVQNFPINQRRTHEYFQLQGMFSSCNIGSVNVVLKENWESIRFCFVLNDLARIQKRSMFTKQSDLCCFRKINKVYFLHKIENSC